jgi:hypothetical protein
VRALIDQGQFKQAADLISSSMMAVPNTQMPYGAAGDLLLDFVGLSEARLTAAGSISIPPSPPPVSTTALFSTSAKSSPARRIR